MLLVPREQLGRSRSLLADSGDRMRPVSAGYREVVFVLCENCLYYSV